MDYEIVLASVCLLTLVFLSTIGSAYGHLSDVSLRRLLAEREESSSTKFLRELVDDHQRFSLTLTAGIQLALLSFVLLLLDILFKAGVSWSYKITFVSGLLVVSLLQQFIPQWLAQREPQTLLLRLLPAFKLVYRGLAPLVMPVYAILRRLRQQAQDEPANQVEESTPSDVDEIQALIDVGEEEGILDSDEGEMIQSIVEFSDTAVNEIMTPRTKITAIEAESTVREARDLIIAAKFSRLPVYREQIDKIEGIIYVRDLLSYWQENRDEEPVIRLVRPAYFVPETKPVADLLEEMQKAKVQIAMVVDEYGGLAGLVTLEDILEEIVGEIEDEDRGQDLETEPDITPVDGGYLVRGDTEIRKIELLYDEDLAADDFTTVAGLLINQLGHMPEVGERINLRDLTFEVTATDPNRILEIRIQKEPAKSNAQEVH